MKSKLPTILLAAGLALAACGLPAATALPTDLPTSAPATQPASFTTEPEPTQILVDLTPAQLAALQDLAATLNIPVDQIQLVSTEAVEWPDGCLGVHLPDVMCTQAIVPGFRIVLSANGETYEYHTNQDGSLIVNATNALSPLQVAVVAPDNTIQLVDTGIAAGSTSVGMPPFGGAAGRSVYAELFGPTGATVIAADDSGIHPLDFIQGPIYGLAVWPGSDGSAPMLAWATPPTTPGSPTELHISTPDGANAQTVVSEVIEESDPPYQLSPLGFTPDGAGLYFSREPYGIGGYIPFIAFSSLYRYNFSDQSVTEIIPFGTEGGSFICLDDLSDDGRLLADHCGEAIKVRNLTDGAVTTITPPAEATEWAALGTARLSPDNSRVAFALARRDPENEQGWVAVSAGLEGSSTLVLSGEPGSYYTVIGWLNNDTLLLQQTALANCSTQCESSLWTVGADGLNPTKLADGAFVAIVGN